jgi:DNA helicase-2/ATP-dependent DNA helicase PcrA
LCDHLRREPRTEEYNEAEHSSDKGDWLADSFFASVAEEIDPYVDFILENTPYSTQHGVKGEEYKDVVVVFDDTEAAWTHYNFMKMLTPATSGSPTEGQNEKSRKLAYVCFSRAEENLRILLFTPNPQSAKVELVSKNLFEDDQVLIME